MAKVELKGRIESVGKIEMLGENNTRVQQVVVMVPGYVDGFGDKKGKDEYWQLAVMGDNIEKFDIGNKNTDSRKAKITAFINSKVWYKKEDTDKLEPQYSMYGVLADVEHII
jgi:hypothetical protein